jgi:hypothetical protein
MPTQEKIKHLIELELKGLCTNCALSSDCIYRMATNKVIVQCELYQLGEEDTNASKLISIQRGLCMNCVKVDTCQLPGKNEGIWHCEEYE